MSDSTSFTFSLPKDTLFYFDIDLKLCAILLFIIVFFMLMTSLTSSLLPQPRIYETFTGETPDGEGFYSYKNINYSNYARIPLTSLDTDVQSPQNIVFGSATRMISENIIDKKMYYILNVEANLYILGGNIYDDVNQKVINQNYTVQLVNQKTKSVLILGNLKKEGDGLYRYTFKIDTDKLPTGTLDELMNYNVVQIIYVTMDPVKKTVTDSQTIIQGNLNDIIL